MNVYASSHNKVQNFVDMNLIMHVFLIPIYFNENYSLKYISSFKISRDLEDETSDGLVIQSDDLFSTEYPTSRDAKKMSNLKDTEDKSPTIRLHTLPSLQIDINEDISTDELNRGDSNVTNDISGSFCGKETNQNDLNLNLGVSISSQVHNFLMVLRI